MTPRIGINPLTWSNDDMPSLGAQTSLATCLAEARAAGYHGVELGHKFPRDAATLGPILEEHGLQLISGWYSARLLERDADAEFSAMQDHLALLTALGCEVMVVAEVTDCIHGDPQARLSRRPRLAAGAWTRFGARLTELAERMRASRMRLAFHHHMGTVVQSAEDIDRLMNHSGAAVELLLDTGHLVFAGDQPARIVEHYGERIAHLHCKDVRRDVLVDCLNRDTSFLDAVLRGVFTVPGDGCIDYQALLSRLVAGGYAGWWVVEAEQDPAIATPTRYARLGFETLSRVAGSLAA